MHQVLAAVIVVVVAALLLLLPSAALGVEVDAATVIAGCPLGFFPCGGGSTSSSSTCLPRELHCNDIIDCDDGEDEQRCDDVHGSKNALADIDYTIPVYNNKSRTGIVCDLSHFPKVCTCNYTALYCSGAGFTTVPATVRGNIRNLILINNKIRSFSVRVVHHYSSLRVIHLEGNEIYRIEPYPSLNKISKVFLQKNKLKTFPPGSLVGLRNVLWIVASENLLEDFDLTVFKDTPHLRFLDFSKNRLKLESRAFPPLPQLVWLDLYANQVEVITSETFQNLATLRVLHLGNNKIHTVHPSAFQNLKKLDELDLSGNRIEFLHRNTFEHLSFSKLLLGGNPLNIPTGLFDLDSLLSLNLEGVTIHNISVDMFRRSTKLEFAYFRKFHYCSFVPHVRVCKPNTDGVSSTEHLLVNPLLRFSVWVVATLTCLGNSLVFVGRLVSCEDNRMLSLCIRNLSAADFLMGIYLFVIGGHDYAFREHYNRHASRWMSSPVCTACGMLAMVSSETSVILLCFMTVERFVCIVSPFGGHRLTVRTARLSMLAIWTAGVGLAMVPVLYWPRGNGFYGRNGVCFPLHIDDPFVDGWQYSAFVFLGVNCVGVVLIGVFYAVMFVSVRRTRRATTLTPTPADRRFAFRFFFIVLTDCLCWLPIIVLKVVAIADVPIEADFHAWVVVFILPINSAINPFLYTFTTANFRAKSLQAFVVGSAGTADCRTCCKRRHSVDVSCDNNTASSSVLEAPLYCRWEATQNVCDESVL